MAAKSGIHKFEDGRTILLVDGVPLTVRMAMRASMTAPSRIKAMLVIPTVNEDGDESIVPLPFAQAVIGIHGKPRGYTPEFRLELN